MPKKYLSIQESADLSKKSIQTIRRAIKAKKLASRRQRTPQGFNYLVESESLCSVYKIKLEPEKNEVKPKIIKKVEIKETVDVSPKNVVVNADDFRSFSKMLEKMISQHSDERQNFLRLVNTLQEKIFVLENQLNLLQAPQKKWYQLWK
ncbi:MAG: hypothetical protein WC269_04030 [Candidatus Gracilibacteria bacterium]|jgi:site-specific DNA-cytosine methylase